MKFVACYSKYNNSLYKENENGTFSLSCSTPDENLFNEWVLFELCSYDEVSVKFLRNQKADEFVEHINN